jgi:beta-lactamase class A
MSTEVLLDRVAAILAPLGGRTAIAASRVASASSRHLPIVSSPAGASSDEDDRDHQPERPVPTSQSANGSDALLLRADDELPAASLAKLPIAIELMRRVDLGQWSLDERFDTSAEPRVGGGAVLDSLDPATRLTLRELCFLMLGVSDNTAANFLLDLVGMGEVNETCSRLNLSHTRLARHFMDFAARAAHRDNVTSAADMHALLALVRSGALPGASSLRGMLAAQQLGEDYTHRLPAAAQIAHKTGTLEDVIHDAGILTGPAGICMYSVLTADQIDLLAARAAVATIVRVLWDVWCAADG